MKKKPSIFINSAQHAREWISPPTTIYMIWKLLTKLKEGDQTIVALFDKINIHFFPVVNPDGYQYTHTNSRMWRKNRVQNRDSSKGVDLNRNWIFRFGGPGSSNVPSSDIYHGTAPLSEVETKTLADYIRENKNIKVGIDYHSFGNYVLRPYDAIRNIPPNETVHKEMGAVIQQAIRAVNGISFSNIRGAEMYIHSGGLLDTFYENFKLDRSFCLELRGGGFVIQPSQLIPSGEENYAALLKVMEWVSKL